MSEREGIRCLPKKNSTKAPSGLKQEFAYRYGDLNTLFNTLYSTKSING